MQDIEGDLAIIDSAVRKDRVQINWDSSWREYRVDFYDIYGDHDHTQTFKELIPAIQAIAKEFKKE